MVILEVVLLSGCCSIAFGGFLRSEIALHQDCAHERYYSPAQVEAALKGVSSEFNSWIAYAVFCKSMGFKNLCKRASEQHDYDELRWTFRRG